MTSDDVCTVMELKMWIGGEEGKYTKLFAGLEDKRDVGLRCK